MSVSAAQASVFYKQLASGGAAFTFLANGEFLVFPVRGNEVVPFWSSRSRAEKVQAMHPKYAAYQLAELSLAEFLERTLPLLEQNRVCVGVNWSGARLTGYDVSVADLRRNLDHHLSAAKV